jgi:3-phenylpropionate/cinnamic acid dioxygenase small subunit
MSDRADITDLLARLALLLDDKRFPDLGTIYTRDAETVSPRGNLHGLDEIIEVLTRASRPAEQTLHCNGAVAVDIDGDHAEIRSNQLVYFFTEGEAPHRFSGGQATYSAARTPDGWRLTRAHIVARWQQGVGAIIAS